MDATQASLMKYLSLTAGTLFSYTMFDLWNSGRLGYFIAVDKFGLLVAATALLLLGMVVLKVLALSNPTQFAHDCGHDHSHAEGEGHDHSHGVNPWRLAVVAVPLVLMLSGVVPKNGLSAAAAETRLTAEQREALAKIGAAVGKSVSGDPVSADWRELDAARLDPVRRSYWDGLTQPVMLAGQVVADGRFSDRYRLTIMKMTCCAADAQPVDISVVGTPPEGTRMGDWVEVVGPLQFLPVPDERSGETSYFPVVHQAAVNRTNPRPYIK